MPYEFIEETSENEQPSFAGEAFRHAGRTALRVGEQIAGAPGDILSLINEYIAAPITSKITGQKGIPYENLPISSILPTSGQLKRGHEKVFGEKIKPKNKVEQFSDDVVETATSIFSPGATIKKGAGLLRTAASSLFKAVGAHTAKEVVKDLTKDEKKATMAHLGALTLLSFIDKKGAAKAISLGYGPLERRVTELMPVSSIKLETNLDLLKSKMMKGTKAPSERFIIDEVDEVLKKIADGKITPQELWASKRSLNEKLSKVLYETPRKDQARARKLSSVISHELDDALQLTKKQDPKFYNELKEWNMAYKTMADSNVISKWIDKNLKYNPATSGLAHLVGGSVAGAAGIAAAPYQLGKIGYRIAKSKKLANHYSKVISSAAIEDASSFNKQLKILDRELQRDEKKDRWEFVD